MDDDVDDFAVSCTSTKWSNRHFFQVAGVVSLIDLVSHTRIESQ